MEEKEITTSVSEGSPKAVPLSSDPVTLTRGQLESIITELESLKRGQRFEKPARVTERTARIRIHEEKPVVWLGNVRDIFDAKQAKKIAWADVKLYEEDKIRTVGYLEFLNSANSVQVKIKSQEVTEIVTSEGSITATNPNPYFDKKFQSYETELTSTRHEYQATVEVLAGELKSKVFILPSTCLNL